MTTPQVSEQAPTLAPAPRTSTSPIGLLAGNGNFPIRFAEAARRQGLSVATVGIKYEASDALIPLSSHFRRVGVAHLGGVIRAFKSWGVEELVMAGKITKSVMYTPWRAVQLVPDPRFLRMWFFGNRKDNKDDSLILAFIREFERDGIRVTSALDYCPELLVSAGLLTRRAPTAAERKDIAFGWMLAKEMGRLDVGQSVAVKERAALAIEAIEGTDRCIERAGQLCRAKGWTLVKVAKPQQDMRFDVPTIGMTTVENLVKAGARVLAIDASKTIVIDQEDVVAYADRNGLTIIAVSDEEIASWG